MKQVYQITGKYMARYPNGHFTGDIGISTSVKAKNPDKAKLLVAEKTAATYGYIDFKWLAVTVKENMPVG